MKWLLLVWMFLNAGGAGLTAYMNSMADSAGSSADAAFVGFITAMSSALWAIVLVVWLIVRA